LRVAPLALLLLTASIAPAQDASVQIPVGTPLPVELSKHVPMKKGALLKCYLLYPIYADNELVIPAGSVARGRVIALRVDRSRRLHSRFWGDFTPFYVPVVRFDQLILPNGNTERIDSNEATDGAPVLHLSPPVANGPSSVIGRQIADAKEHAKETIALVTAPGRTDRLVQFIYRQLPYHPQRIETATTWTVTLAKPLVIESNDVSDAKGHTVETSHESERATAEADQAWHIRAYLEQTISSANEKAGDTFEARVAEPIFNPDHSLAVPQGSVLEGTITRVRPARSFGRAGTLRFNFRALKLPGSPPQHVTGTLAAADAAKAQQLEIDREGGVEPKPQNRVIVPLILTLLAGRTLSDDGSVASNAAVGSNGFGAIGRAIGMTAGSRGLAAAIGFYGAGVSLSERWLVRGQDVSFQKNTRIEITTIPSRNPLSGGQSKTSH
jgi:hypothetical protein